MNPGLVVVPEVIAAPALRKEIPTLAEFAEVFLLEQTGAVKPSARDALKSLVGLLVAALGTKRLDEIDQPTVNRYIGTMKKLARGTVNNRLATLSSILEYAGPTGAGHIGKSALVLHVKDDEDNTPITAVPADDVAKLLATCTSKRDRVAVLLASEAGLRVGEILGVQWTDIKDGCLTVRRQIDGRANVTKPKHNVVRTVPLSPALVSALGALPRRGIWIVCKRDGASLTYQGLRYMVVSLYERAGVTIPATDAGIRRPWHSLRHYFGTACAARGVPMPVLQQPMGHKDITTTMIYVDVHEHQKLDAIALAFGSTTERQRAGNSWQSSV